MSLLLLALAASLTARAGVARHALLVGHNEGSSAERPLYFAEEDARRMARTLMSAAGTDPSRTTILTGPGRNELLHALADLREAVEADAVRGDDTLVLFFYSGHADATGMHLGRQTVSWEELQVLLDRTGATVRVAFLDACESGAMADGVRTKGAARAPAFAVELADRLTASGQVVFTSSAADQVSHESDALGGSYFTHHLASALAGAADTNQDGSVTLDEAWSHVARETAFQTKSSRTGSQTPTYAWDLTGTGHLVLTAPGRGTASLRFPAGVQGSFAVFDVDRRAFVAQVVLTGAEARDVGLAPGEYIVQQRLPDHLEVGRIALEAGEHRTLTDVGFDAVSYEDDAIKGALAQKSRRARRPELGLSVGPTLQSYLDPADADLSVPTTGGLSGELVAIWPSGIRVGLHAYNGAGAGAVAEDVPFSVGEASASSFGVSTGWTTAPRVWRVAGTVQLTRLAYDIDYPEYHVDIAQSLRTWAPGVGAVAGVYPSWFALELSGRTHAIRYVVDGEPAGIRFSELTVSAGVRR